MVKEIVMRSTSQDALEMSYPQVLAILCRISSASPLRSEVQVPTLDSPRIERLSPDPRPVSKLRRILLNAGHVSYGL